MQSKISFQPVKSLVPAKEWHKSKALSCHSQGRERASLISHRRAIHKQGTATILGIEECNVEAEMKLIQQERRKHSKKLLIGTHEWLMRYTIYQSFNFTKLYCLLAISLTYQTGLPPAFPTSRGPSWNEDSLLPKIILMRKKVESKEGNRKLYQLAPSSTKGTRER